jgi:IclR family transcriptional regulator, KDG regulon repressor
MRQIVDKISAILSLYSFEKSDWGVTEISKKLSMPKSTVSELLSSLVEQGFLSRSVKARFSLGWRFFGLNQILLESTPMVRESRKAMTEVAERTGEICHFMVLDRADSVVVEKVQPSGNTTGHSAKVGVRCGAYASAGGKVMLAFMPWDQIESLFASAESGAPHSATIQSLDKLRSELEIARERGVAFDREGLTSGVTSVAAPIRDYNGKVIASISLSASSQRFSTAEMQFVSIIAEAGRKVSSGLGYDVRNQP